MTDFLDSDTIVLALAPSGTDVLELVDANTARLTLTPSSLETYERPFPAADDIVLDDFTQGDQSPLRNKWLPAIPDGGQTSSTDGSRAVNNHVEDDANLGWYPSIYYFKDNEYGDFQEFIYTIVGFTSNLGATPFAGAKFCVLACMRNVGGNNPSTMTNYAFIVTKDATTHKLAKWTRGGPNVYDSLLGYGTETNIGSTITAPAPLSIGDKLGIRVGGGKVSGWAYQSGAWFKVCEATDSTWNSGYGGFACNDMFNLDDFVGQPYPRESLTVPLALTPSATESLERLDAGTAILTLTPSDGSAEHRVPFDSDLRIVSVVSRFAITTEEGDVILEPPVTDTEQRFSMAVEKRWYISDFIK